MGRWYSYGMTRLKPFVALMVLTLWASCTIRCELVSLVCCDEVACCDSADSKSPEKPAPADQCVCSWARSGEYIAARNDIPLPLPAGVPLFTLAAPLEVPTGDARVTKLIFSPPDLSTRAAALPRAPSFVS